jgi:hypothetical protein
MIVRRCRARWASAGVLVLVVALVGCGGDASGGRVSAEQACPDGSPSEVLVERLTSMTPSSSFAVGENVVTYVAVTFDPQFNVGGLAPSPWDLFVLDAAAAPSVDGSDPLGVPEDTRISISDLDDYRPVEVTPGTYRLYSRGSPVIRVIHCDATRG